MIIEDQLADYLFVHVFKSEYRMKEFMSGESVYMASTGSFLQIENNFQGDRSECAIIPFSDSAKGAIWVGSGYPEVKICDTVGISAGIQGHLFCMFMIPKAYFTVKNEALYVDKESPYHADFFRFLDEYLRTKGKAFVCIFDAEQFMRRIAKRLQEKGLLYTSGLVKYQDMTIEDRVELFTQRKIEEIVFTKQKEYQYQHEYRIIVSNATGKDHIEVDGVSMENIIFLSGEYHSQKGAPSHAD